MEPFCSKASDWIPLGIRFRLIHSHFSVSLKKSTTNTAAMALVSQGRCQLHREGHTAKLPSDVEHLETVAKFWNRQGEQILEIHIYCGPAWRSSRIVIIVMTVHTVSWGGGRRSIAVVRFLKMLIMTKCVLIRAH